MDKSPGDSSQGMQESPKRKAAEVCIQWLAANYTDHSLDKPHWPDRRAAVWLLATRFLLREVELANLTLSSADVAQDQDRRTITIHLSIRKSDQAGRECTRTLACSCDATLMDPSCPYRVGKGDRSLPAREDGNHPV